MPDIFVICHLSTIFGVDVYKRQLLSYMNQETESSHGATRCTLLLFKPQAPKPYARIPFPDSYRICLLYTSLGIDEVYSELLPGDKVAKVEELLARKGSKEKLAFVGDCLLYTSL